MIICNNCGAKLADHSKICYACKTVVGPDWKHVSEYDPVGSNFDVMLSGEDSRDVIDYNDKNIKNVLDEDSDKDSNKESNDDKKAERESLEKSMKEFRERYLNELNMSQDEIYKKMDEESGNTELTEEEKLIGDNGWMYILRFKQMKERNSIFTWNWWAFLLGPIWFAYHKMYAWTVALLGIDAVFTVIDTKSIGTILIDIIIAIFANRFLMDHIDALKRKVDMLSNEKREQYITRHGGTSIVATVLIVGIYYLVKFFILKYLSI